MLYFTGKRSIGKPLELDYRLLVAWSILAQCGHCDQCPHTHS